MAASGAKSSQGTLFQVSDGEAVAAWTSLAEVKTISGPGIKRETYDVTHLNSDGGAREFIAGFIDGGEISMELNLLMDATQLDLLAKLKDETDAGTKKTADIIRSYRLVFPDATLLTDRSRFTFDAICTGFEPKVDDGPMTLSTAFRTVGKPVFTDPAL